MNPKEQVMIITPRKAVLAALLALPLLAAACGGGGSSSAPAATSTPAAAAAATGGTVDSASSSLGQILVAKNGMTLYMFASDKNGKSSCFGPCAQFWPPYTGTPKAGAGLNASLLGTTMRSDGTTQVTYDGHPLYTYAGDSGPGTTNGQGVSTYGALWWVVAPNGKVVKTAAQQSSTGSSGGGYGY
jgi:predicted lipoprotein with Yx(FWY)xxD motif